MVDFALRPSPPSVIIRVIAMPVVIYVFIIVCLVKYPEKDFNKNKQNLLKYW